LLRCNKRLRHLEMSLPTIGSAHRRALTFSYK
jgi:hypothetical protein